MPFFGKFWRRIFGTKASNSGGEKDGKAMSETSTESISGGVKHTTVASPKVESTVGTKSELKHLYLDENEEWTDKYPKKVKPPPENNETAQFALLVRHQKSRNSHKKLELNSIVVQSPYIKQVLGKVFAGYHGITTTLERLEFKTPFEPFFHRWEEFQAAILEVHDPTIKEHLNLLWITLEEDLSFKLERSKNLISNGVMTHDLLWTMFAPGILVFVNNYTYGQEYEQVRKLQKYEINHYSDFKVWGGYVDWDGKCFGLDSSYTNIPAYSGTKKITDLSIYPLSYHPDLAGVQKRCIARGRLFESYQGYHFKAYRKDDEVTRIIIDTSAWNKVKRAVELEKLPDDPTYQAPQTDVEPTGQSTLSDYQLLITFSYLRGFCLKAKDFQFFRIDLVEDIIWNELAFPSLVLPGDTKDLILAFAQSQLKGTQKFDDVIKGKGKGTVMLLSGPPGVGKTLTAEAVAEKIRVPLYTMSAAELGLTPSTVEERLTSVLERTTKWKAVLLLDEADVFLEARSTHDLERNKLVSIFLRVLEYYEGFLFLTSNRVEDIDTAFESRIHLSLQYEHLSVESRIQVWKTFLGAAGDKFSEEQLSSLAQIQLNGRQIKNIVKTSLLLATSKDNPLGFRDVDVVTSLRAANLGIPTKAKEIACCHRCDA